MNQTTMIDIESDPACQATPKNSTHKVEVVPVSMQPHPNADSLSIIPIFGYTYVGRTADWIGVNRAAYVLPDSVVDVTRPEFAFLAPQTKGATARIRAKKLRGVISFGLLIPLADDAPLGGDMADELGVTHYEPQSVHSANAKHKGRGLSPGEAASGPSIYTVKYDLEAMRRYHKLFTHGEPVVVTEKLDGANARYVFHEGVMHCGSRTEWKKEFPTTDHITIPNLIAVGVNEEKANQIVENLRCRPPKRNQWWEILRSTPSIEAFCQANPGTILYGEIYGSVNCIKYGLERDQFAAFDVMQDGRWLDPQDAHDELMHWKVPIVPIFNAFRTFHLSKSGRNGGYGGIVGIPFDFERLCELAEGETDVEGAKPGTIKEGIVVSPMIERTHPFTGRVKLKIVSGAYLEKYH